MPLVVYIGGFRQTPVDYFIFSDNGIRHNDQPVIQGADSRGAQTDVNHIAPRLGGIDINAITNAERLVKQDRNAGYEIGHEISRP